MKFNFWFSISIALFLPFGTLSKADTEFPAEGNSTFDLFAFRNHSTQTDIPYPLDRLRQELGSFNADLESSQTSVLIPMGRSLQKPLVASPMPFAFPRVVFSFGNFGPRGERNASTVATTQLSQSGTSLGSQVFVAYHEPRNQLEIISWNPNAGRYEFQIVKNYGPGKNPELYYAHRTVCLSCHVGGGPIFPVLPWDETNANDAVAVLIRKARALEGDPSNFYQTVQIQDQDEAAAGLASFKSRNRNAQNLENSVFFAEWLIKSAETWRMGCPMGFTGATCRARLLDQVVSLGLLGEKLSDTPPPLYSATNLSPFLSPLMAGRNTLGKLVEAAPYATANTLRTTPIMGERLWTLSKSLSGPENPLLSLTQAILELPLTEAQNPELRHPGAELSAQPGFSERVQMLNASILGDQRNVLLKVLRDPGSRFESAIETASFAIRLQTAPGSQTLSVRVANFPGLAGAADDFVSTFSLPVVGLCTETICSLEYAGNENTSDPALPSFRLVLKPLESGVSRSVMVHSLLHPTFMGELVLADGRKVSLSCVRTQDGSEVSCHNVDLEWVANAVDRVFSENPEISKGVLLPRTPFLSLIMDPACTHCGKIGETPALPKAIIPSPSLIELSSAVRHPALKRVIESCARCHWGADSTGPTLLSGETEFELMKGLKENGLKMIERMEAWKRRMPQKSSAEAEQFAAHPELRSALIEELRKITRN